MKLFAIIVAAILVAFAIKDSLDQWAKEQQFVQMCNDLQSPLYANPVLCNGRMNRSNTR